MYSYVFCNGKFIPRNFFQLFQMEVSSPVEYFEHGGDEADLEAILLPQSEPIPQQVWTMAHGWIPVVGRDIVACLFSRDWQVPLNIL